MVQKLYFQSDGRIVVLNASDYDSLSPYELSKLKKIEQDHFLMRVFNEVNPNFSYVFGEKPHLLESYFRSKHKDLPNLLIDLYIGSEIDFFEIGKNDPDYKDYELRRVLLQFMDLNKPQYRILKLEDKLGLRIPISNKEAIPIIKSFVYEMPHDESLIKKVTELEKNLYMWRLKIGTMENIPLSPDITPEYSDIEREREEIRQFVYGAVPLWPVD